MVLSYTLMRSSLQEQILLLVRVVIDYLTVLLYRSDWEGKRSRECDGNGFGDGRGRAIQSHYYGSLNKHLAFGAMRLEVVTQACNYLNCIKTLNAWEYLKFIAPVLKGNNRKANK